MDNLIHVAVLEDHQTIIDGYFFRLSFTPNIRVMGAVNYGDDLIPFLSKNDVDVLILDISVQTSKLNPNPFPVMHTIPEILNENPWMNILVISMHNQPGIIHGVLEAGCHGYIIKDDRKTIAMIGEAVQIVSSGKRYLSQQVQDILAENCMPVCSLTNRQLEILSLCASHPGASLNQLATRLGVARSTIRNLLSSTYRILEVQNRTAAVIKARQMGIITPDEPGAN